MAAINDRIRNVKFNVDGFQEIIRYQEVLIKNKEKDLQKERATLSAMTAGTKEYEKQEKVVNRLQKQYDKLNDELNKFTKDVNVVRNAFENLDTIGPKVANRLDVAFKRLAKAGIKLSDDMKIKIEDLVGKGKNVTGALVDMFSKGFNFEAMTKGVDKTKATYTELGNYVQIFEKHGRDLALIANDDAKAFAMMGEQATAAKIKMGEMDGTLVGLTRDASPQKIKEYIKSWQEIANYSGATAQQIQQAKAAIRMARGLQAQQDANTLRNAGNFSPAEVKEAEARLQEYLRTEKTLAQSVRKDLTEAVKEGTDAMKRMAQTDQLTYLSNQFKNLRTLSTDALGEQKKYWTELVSNTSKGSTEYLNYLGKLKMVEEQERKNNALIAERNGRASLMQVRNGAYERTTQEIQKQIEVLTKWRAVIDRKADPSAFAHVDSAIRQLNRDLIEAQENVQMAQKYMQGGFGKATIQDLNKIRSGLQDMRTKLQEAGDASGIAKLDAKIREVENDIRKAGISEKEFQMALNNPKGVFSLKTLEAAYEKLKAEISRAGISQKEFNDKAMQMKAIRTQIDGLRGSWNNANNSLSAHNSLMQGLANQIRNIVLHWVGLQMIMMKIFNMLGNFPKLAEQMTKVRKVTGMTGKEVVGLTEAIYDIDTRTANDELMALAEQAGKLGIATREGAEGVKQFATVGQMVLDTLGDIGGAEGITELLKINDLFQDPDNKMSVGEQLHRIGSAVLEVGNNSKASYQGVVEFTKRLGPAGAAVKLTQSEVMGLGGVFSSLGTEASVAATAMQRILFGLVNNTEAVAKSVNTNTQELRDLIANGKTMEALQIVLSSVSESGGNALQKVEALLKAVGGKNTMQSKSAITLLASHMGDLQYQLALANEGYEKAIQLNDAFELSNENLAGVLDRISNEFQEMFTSASATNGVLRDMAKMFLYLVQWIRKSGVGLSVFVGLLAGLVTYAIQATRASMAAAAAAETAGKAYKGWWGSVAGLIDMLRFGISALFNHAAALMKVEGAADRATAATNRFKVALSSNWVTAIIMAVTLLVSWIARLGDKSKETAERIAEMTEKGESEIRTLGRLKNMIADVNTEQKLRVGLVADFNKIAGQYIGNLLKEEDAANKVAIAYHKAAAEIRKKMAAQLEEEGQKKAKEESREERTKASKSALKTLGNLNMFESEEDRQAAVAQVQASIEAYFEDPEIQDKTIKGAMKMVQRKYAKKFTQKMKGKNGEYDVSWLTKGNHSYSLYNSFYDYAEAIAGEAETAQPYDIEARTQRRRAASEALKQMASTRKRLDSEEAMTDRERYDLIMEYIDLQKEQKNNPNNTLGAETAKRFAKELDNLRSSVHPWGTPNAEPGMLNKEEVAAIIKYFDEIGNPRGGKKLLNNATHIKPAGIELPSDIDTWSQQNITDWAHDQWTYWKKYNDEINHATGEGHFKLDKEGADKMRQELDMARKRLEEYYKRNEELATNALNEGKVTQGAYNAYMLAQHQEMLANQEILEEKFLDNSKRFTTEAVNEWMKTVVGVNGVERAIDYDKITAYLDSKGKNLVGGIRDNAAKYAAELQASIRKHQQDIEKILLDERPIAKLAQQFMNDLDEFNGLTPDWDEVFDDEDAEAKLLDRLSFLMEEAKKGYDLTAEQFIEDMKNANYGAMAPWAEALLGDPETLSALLLKVKGFGEQYEEAVRKMQSDMSKRFEQELKTAGADGTSFNSRADELKKGLDETSKYNARRQHSQQQADSWGFTGKNLAGVGDAEKYNLTVLNQQAEAELALYNVELQRFELMKERNAAEIAAAQERAERAEGTKEEAMLLEELEAKRQAAHNMELEQTTKLASAWKSVEDAQMAAQQGLLDTLSNSIAQAQPYYEDLKSFADEFGGHVFGSKEEREQAGRDLLKSLIKTTGQMLTQWLIYISTKKIFDQMELAQEKAKQMQLYLMAVETGQMEVAAHASAVLAKLGIDAAEVSEDAIKAQAKEAAKAGWIGWAIGAGLSLLMTTLFSAAASKVKSAASAAGGKSAGKLTTNMLTYAEGKYPTMDEGVAYDVDANGKRYNATYSRAVKTGVYHKPHLALFSEEGDEMVIDHPTLVRTMEQAPWLLKGIQDIHRNGRLTLDYARLMMAAQTLSLSRGRSIGRMAHGMRAYAEGNIDEVLAGGNAGGLADSLQGTEQLLEVLSGVSAALDNLAKNPVHVKLFGGNDSLDARQKELNDWKKRNNVR